ncbi:MAG: 2-methylcitrate dehydratase PrpD, partial [Gammaproteobacteria bacterium]
GQTDLPGDSIDRVSITVHPSYLKVCNIAEPVTGLEAKFSLRFTGAMMLSGWDTASLDQFSSDACQNTELVSLRDKIKVNTDQELTETQAKVTITTFDGSVLSASHDLDNPMSTEIRQQKVCHKAAALIGGQHQGNIWQNIIAPDADSMNVLATTVANSN